MDQKDTIQQTQAKIWKTLDRISAMDEKARQDHEKARQDQAKARQDQAKARQEMAEIRTRHDADYEKARQDHEKARREMAEIRDSLAASTLKSDQDHEKAKQELAEMRRQMEITDKKLRAFIGATGNQWGKLSENLVKGGLIQRLKERGVKHINRITTNAKRDNTEYDIIAINGKEVVVVEVKSTLDPSDVHDFAENINQFKTVWPEYKDKIIYGALAYLMKANRQADQLAQKQGFFVIEATGDVIIQNKKSFKPKVFG